MNAMVVEKPASIETSPLRHIEMAIPEPQRAEIRIRVTVCGVCRTDLHVAEGDLPPRHLRIIPGHEVVGLVDAVGECASRFKRGDRVGIAWLAATCGRCRWCASGRENLCADARFTGYDRDGGYAEYAIVHEDFAHRIPAAMDDEQAAPMLCAGIIGYRAIKRAGVVPGATVGLYGFGGSAHIAMQVLRHWGCRVFVMSRGGAHRDLASELGAEWIGNATDKPPAQLDHAILFAPAGELVLPAMEALGRGGILAIAGIHLSDVPPLNYQRHLFFEREIRSVTANTRADAAEFLKLAAEIPVRTSTMPFRLADANEALKMLRNDAIKGAAVLRIS